MQTLEVIKAWKDEEYRDTLTLAEREKLPVHPAGVIELESPRRADNDRFGPVNKPHTQNIGCTFIFHPGCK